MKDLRIAAMSGYADLCWGLQMFERDPLEDRFPPESRRRIVEDALHAGCAAGEAWRSGHPGVLFAQWMENSGLKVVFDGREQLPPYLVFSVYSTQTEQITLYSDAIKRAGCAAEGCIRELADGNMVRDLLLAHEYFHYMEEHNAVDFGGRNLFTCKTLWMKKKCELIAYSEIAACAFAKKVCGATFFPALLDVLLLATYDAENIEKYNCWFRRHAARGTGGAGNGAAHKQGGCR